MDSIEYKLIVIIAILLLILMALYDENKELRNEVNELRIYKESIEENKYCPLCGHVLEDYIDE